MGKSAKFSSIYIGLMAAALLFALPQNARAQVQNVVLGDSFVTAMKNNPTTDTRLVPGGILRVTLNTMGAFGAQGALTNNDTFIGGLQIFMQKSSFAVPFSSIVDTLQLVLDANNDQVKNTSENNVISSISTPTNFGTDTALYTFGTFRRPLNPAESYALVVYTRYDTALTDTSFFIQIPNRGATIEIDSATATQVQRPLVGTITFPTFQFKIYNDSTGRVFQGNYFRHRDSAVSAPGFTIFQGTIQGESRTVGGDSLTKFGVAFGGTAGANVDSAWALFGTTNQRVDLARTTGTHWAAANISTISLALAGGLDTFRVVVTVGTPPLQSTLGCTIPIDSVATKFRRSNTSIIDSSGIVTFTRPRGALSDSVLANISVHPDSRTGQFPALLAQGTILQDTLLSPILAADSVTRFGVRLAFGGGMTYLDVESVGITVNGTTYTASAALATSGSDSFLTAVIAQNFAASTTYSVNLNLRETAPIGGTIRAIIPVDSVNFRYRSAAGPSDSVVGSRLMTVMKPRVAITDSALGNIAVHPDTRVQNDSFLIAQGTINGDTLLTPALPYDTIARFQTRMIVGGALVAGDIDTVIIVLNGTSYVTSSRVGDTFGILPNQTVSGTTTYQIYVRTNNTAPVDGTLRAQILVDSIATIFRVNGPSDSVIGSRLVTINKPRIALTDSALGNIAVHPDTRVQNDSFLILQGTINADTLLTPPLSNDTIVSFQTRLVFGGGMTNANIDTVIFVLNGISYVTQGVNADTFAIRPIAQAVTGTTTYQIYVRTNNNAPVGGTVNATIPAGDSLTAVFPNLIVGSTFRIQGPAATLVGSRTVTMLKPRVVLTDSGISQSNLVHPDSRVQNDSFILGAFFINADTLLSPPLSYDTITRIQIRLLPGGTFNPTTDIDTIIFAIGNTSYVTSSRVGDTFGITPNQTITGTTTVVVYARTFDTMAAGSSSIQMQVLVDSIAAIFRDTGPAQNLIVNRVIFITKPRVTLTDSALGNIRVHPDTRVQNDSFLIAQGTINGDTLLTPALPYDTILRFQTRLNLGAGLVTGDIDTVIMVLNGTSYVTSSRVADTFGIVANQTVSGTTTYQIYVRTNNTAPVDGTINAQILIDSIASRFRVNGPSAVVTGSRTATISRPRATLTDSALGGINVRADSRIFSMPIVLAQGTIQQDTLLTPILAADSVTRFGVRLQFGGGMTYLDVESVGVTLNGVTYIASFATSAAASDSYLTAVIVQPFAASTTYSILLNLRETAPVGGTIRANIPVDSATFIFRAAGPSAIVTGSRLVTISRDSIFIYTEPRNPTFSSAIQVRDTVVLAWFVPQSDLEADTMFALDIRLFGVTDSTRVDTIFLARDANRNRKYDTQPSTIGATSFPRDTIVGFFRALSGAPTTTDTWRLTVLSNGVNGDSESRMITDTYRQQQGGVGSQLDTAEYVIVIVLKDSATIFASIRAQIPERGAKGTFTDSGSVTTSGGGNLFESFTVIPRDTTPPLPPISFSITTGIGNSFRISWGPSASGDTGMLPGGQYNLYWAGITAPTKDSFPNTILEVRAHVSGQTSYDTTLTSAQYGFVDGQTYRFRVTAQDQAGNEGNSSLVITAVFKADTAPVPAVQGVIVQPSAGDFVFKSNAVTLVAKLTAGNASTVQFCTFSIRPLSGGAYKVIGVASDSTFAEGTYYFSALFNANDVALVPALPTDDSFEIKAVFSTVTQADSYATAININLTTSQILATYVSLLGDTSGRVDTAGGTDTVSEIIQVSTTVAAKVVFARTPSGIFDLALNLAQGTLNLDTDKLIINGQRGGLTDTEIRVITSRGVRIPAYLFRIILQSGQTTLRNGNSRITINYIDVNGDGIDDSTGIDMTKSPIFYTFNAAGQLEALDGIIVDRTTKTISATVRHFSPFFISNDTGLNTVGLNRLIVGPNPWRPNDGIDENGKPFNASDLTSGIIFKNLPNQVRIEIYTILGEKITQIDKNNAFATINWGARNDDGKDVASGYYLYVVTDIGTGQRVTGKVAVVR